MKWLLVIPALVLLNVALVVGRTTLCTYCWRRKPLAEQPNYKLRIDVKRMALGAFEIQAPYWARLLPITTPAPPNYEKRVIPQLNWGDMTLEEQAQSLGIPTRFTDEEMKRGALRMWVRKPVSELRRNYGTKEHPCSVPPPPDPKPEKPEGAEPLDPKLPWTEI